MCVNKSNYIDIENLFSLAQTPRCLCNYGTTLSNNIKY